MREKLAIANQLRVSRKNFYRSEEGRKICSKCYRTYIVECIIKGREKFSVSYGSEYMDSFLKRMSDWCRYVFDSVYGFLMRHLTPSDDKTLKKYELIHFGADKPIHLKIAKTPNEWILHDFLEKNGFKITDEHLYCNSTVYEVIRE